MIYRSLLMTALSIGIKYDDFWGYTLRDLKLIFKGYKEKRKIDQQGMYLQALLTANMIGTLFDKNAKIPSFEDIFESDTPEYQAKKNRELVDQLKQFAAHANEQRRRKQEDGDRRRET